MSIKMNTCINCGKGIDRRSKRCVSCAKSGENHPFWGKHLSEETRIKLSETNSGKNHPNWKGGISLPGKCRDCGKQLTNYAAERCKSCAQKGKVLSEETKMKLSKARIGENNPNWNGGLPKCLDCGKPLSRGGKRCKSCANMGENNPLWGKKCSEKTRLKMAEAHRGEKHPNWKGGISFEPYPPLFNGSLKRAIRERDDYTCMLCGEYPSKLVHHIDYNKENCDPDNLITLCRSCNGRANFDRESWIGYFTTIIQTGRQPFLEVT